MRGLDGAIACASFGVLRGGNTNNSNNAGAFYFNTNNTLSNTNSNIAFRASLVIYWCFGTEYIAPHCP